jgi:hypothetical protein
LVKNARAVPLLGVNRVIPAWSVGIRLTWMSSGRIHANLDSAIYAGMTARPAWPPAATLNPPFIRFFIHRATARDNRFSVDEIFSQPLLYDKLYGWRRYHEIWEDSPDRCLAECNSHAALTDIASFP